MVDYGEGSIQSNDDYINYDETIEILKDHFKQVTKFSEDDGITEPEEVWSKFINEVAINYNDIIDFAILEENKKAIIGD